MEDLKAILQTDSRMTIFRKLRQLPYISSYTHCGRYYTLETLARYNDIGVWGFNQIYFSRYGTLKNTVLENIEKSSAGLTSNELGKLLHVPVFNTVLDLYKAGKANRKQIGNEYVYLSRINWKAQFYKRKQQVRSENPVLKNDIDGYLALFMSLLNEKQQRLFAGYESLKHGYGGDKKVAIKTGLNVKTVSRGRKELISKNIDMSRIREIGAGRPSLKKTKKP